MDPPGFPHASELGTLVLRDKLRKGQSHMVEGTYEAEDGRYAILEVFGLKLEVSNPHLAELLTMDAREALATDVRDLVTGRIGLDDVVEQDAESMIVGAVPGSDEALRLREEFSATAATLGQRLGFEVLHDDTWRSPTGVEIVTRTVERPLPLAAAAHFVAEVAAVTERPGGEGAVLFIVESQQTADVFKVAIRQRRLYNAMRTVSVDNLADIASMLESGSLDHRQVVVLVAPVANIDVGEILSVLHADEQAR